jgi:hypothetical protein
MARVGEPVGDEIGTWVAVRHKPCHASGDGESHVGEKPRPCPERTTPPPSQVLLSRTVSQAGSIRLLVELEQLSPAPKRRPDANQPPALFT